MLRLFTAALGAVLVLSPLVSLADDWAADKLRGQVVQLVGSQWQPLTRGMVVPDSRMVRTMKTGHVTFVRGTETVELGPDTQIQIHDKAGSKPFTTVKQYFGSVSVEADIRRVQHFGVDTPFLAAVVKGTRFTVTSDKAGSSVGVRRGHVAVENLHTHSMVTLSVGQTAIVGAAKADETKVSGSGKLPTVVDTHGDPIDGLSIGPPGLDIEISSNGDLDSSSREASAGDDGGDSGHDGSLTLHLSGLHRGL